MFDFDDDEFDNDEGRDSWTRFWNLELGGEPLWYVLAMAAVPLYVGLLISRLHYADAVLPWILGFMIAGGMIMLVASLRHGE